MLKNKVKYTLLFLMLQLGFVPSLSAEWAKGIPVGAEFPNIKAQDHTANPQANEKLMGENGMLFFFNRSSDW